MQICRTRIPLLRLPFQAHRSLAGAATIASQTAVSRSFIDIYLGIGQKRIDNHAYLF